MGRIGALDACRGMAILMMVVYHALFDLDYLGLAHIGLGDWQVLLLQKATGILFVAIAGISMGLSHGNGPGSEGRHIRRAGKLALVALLISAATWIYPHAGFIRFGVIHLLAASTIIAIPFLRSRKASIATGILLIAAGIVVDGMVSDNQSLFWLGITYPGYHALDHYPILPWSGLFLVGLGISGGAASLLDGIRTYGRAGEALMWMGRNSLAIYLAHQPIMFGALLAYSTALAG